MVVLVAPGQVTPLAPTVQRLGFGSTWTSWDGTVWDLQTTQSGVMLTNEGLRGLNMPPITRQTSSTPALAGSSWRGYSVGEREAFWPLFVYSDGTSQEWVEHDRRLWRSFHPEKPGIWTVTQPSGESRTLTLRYADDGSHAFAIDPAFAGWSVYGITLVAEEPFWLGEPIIRTWGPSDAQNYFGGAAGGGFGPPYYISSGSSVATATIENPGDVPAWPTWTVYGPSTAATVGVGTTTVSVPITLTAGHWVTIDTSPDKQFAVDDLGVDRTDELGSADFAPIPPGESVELGVDLTGTGFIEGRIQPAYLRAW